MRLLQQRDQSGRRHGIDDRSFRAIAPVAVLFATLPSGRVSTAMHDRDDDQLVTDDAKKDTEGKASQEGSSRATVNEGYRSGASEIAESPASTSSRN
jgi:hypothetical protein